MSANLVTKRFTINGSWVAPAGVKNVKIKSYKVNANPAIISNTAIAVTAYNDLWAWGSNETGQMGDKTTVGKSSPVLVTATLNYKQVSFSSSHAACVDTNGNLFCWGSNSSGELGTDDLVPRSSPTSVVGTGPLWKWASSGRSSGGGDYSLGLSHEGDAWGWGRNSEGTIGDGTTTDKSSPVQVVGGYKFRKVEAGFGNSGGLTPDGNIYTWGANTQGNLGDGTQADRSSPVLVIGGYNFRDFSIGAFVGAGITTDNDLYMWGYNVYGQLGNGTRASTSSPVLVSGGKKWAKVYSSAAGLTGSTVAIDTDGNMWAWGYNEFGQLGDGTTNDRSSPVLVTGGKKWISCSAGGLSVIGMDHLGVLYSWGFNGYGQLGLGDNNVRSSPTLVVGSKTWRSMQVTLAIELNVAVTPGTTYAISLTGPIVTFGTDTFLNETFGDSMVELEYFT